MPKGQKREQKAKGKGCCAIQSTMINPEIHDIYKVKYGARGRSYDQTKDFEEVKRREEKPVSNLPESSLLASTWAQHHVRQEEPP